MRPLQYLRNWVASVTIVLIALVACDWGDQASAVAAESEWVHVASDGQLVYKTTPVGDRVMDFSYAGYMGGGVALPVVDVVQTVRPSGREDDSDEIQAAIRAVSALPLKDGFRGAVLLAPGTYACSKPIVISASGVVLRGSASGADGGEVSTLKLTGRPHVAIAVRARVGQRTWPRASTRSGISRSNIGVRRLENC